ncbi:MAG: nitrate/nitrite transporter NrtS [Planctomycetota bacterium]|nr:nitrate/nitrite transporter NrtS [Planctomycetota bacterium]
MTSSSSSSIAIAFSWPVVRRSLMIAAVVGTILIAINHGSTIYCGQFDSMCAMKCSLTMVVPYCVSTLSSVLACRAQQ